MGSGSSHLGARSSRNKAPSRPKQRLASLFCGASTSRSSQREDRVAGSVVHNTGCFGGAVNETERPAVRFSLTSCDAGFTSSNSEAGTSSESSSMSTKPSTEDGPNKFRTSGKQKCLSECTGRMSQISGNSDMHAVKDHDRSTSSFQHEDLENLHLDQTSTEETTETLPNANSIPCPAISDMTVGSQSQENDNNQEMIPSELGILFPDRAQARTEESLLHVNVVTLSANASPTSIDELSTRQGRRNSRRALWEAFSSRRSRNRHTDFPPVLFTTEDGDDIEYRRRWLLDFGNDIFDDGVGGDSWHLGRRSHTTNESIRSRSEFWGRLRGVASERGRRPTCPLNLHRDGSCLCELDDEVGSFSSVSRIVVLAEALFEVLHELHLQPELFSLSMFSVPAPESVVDSLPLKSYEKHAGVEKGDEIEQCYICLSEYEAGDRIRVLPCNHEYHMSCVDKWLKEIHGVCPLCRRGVRESSNPDVDLT